MSKTEKAGRDVATTTPRRLPGQPDEMDRWFDSLFSRGFLRPFGHEFAWPELPAMPFEGRIPKVDVIDRDSEVLVRAELPGVDKDDVEVSVSGGAVTIRGETKRESKEEKGDYYRSEISRGSFQRTIALPGAVDIDRVKAKFRDGVLELTMPKLEVSRRRSVNIE
jgi:HSP20 family protein